MGQPSERGARGRGLFNFDFLRGGRAKESSVLPPNPLQTATGLIEEAMGEVRRQNIFKGGESYRETAAEIVLSAVLGQVHSYDGAVRTSNGTDDGQLAFIGGTSPKIVRDPLLDFITQYYLDHPSQPWGPNNPPHEFASFRNSIARHTTQPLQFNDEAVDYLMTYMRNQERGDGDIVFFGNDPHLDREYPFIDWQKLGFPDSTGEGDVFALIREHAWNNSLQEAMRAAGRNGVNVDAPDGRRYHLIHQNGLVACASEPVGTVPPQAKKLAFLTSRAALAEAGLIQ